MTKRTQAVALLVAVALAFPEGRVAAQADDEAAVMSPADQKKEASAHFQRGADLFEEGLYRAALVELQRAYELAPNYRVLYNIAQTHVALGEFVAAIRAFESMLAQGGVDIDKKRQAEIRNQITELTKRTGAVSVKVEGGAASVQIDGIVVGNAPIENLPVDVGRRVISASGANGASANAEVDIAGGDLKELTLTLSVPVSDSAVAALPTEPEKPRLTVGQKWGVGLMAGGGAIALTGMAVAFMAKSSRDSYEDARNSYPGNADDIHAAHDELSRRSLTADVLFGTAAAVAVTGAVLMFTTKRGKADQAASSARLRFGITPRALVAEGRF